MRNLTPWRRSLAIVTSLVLALVVTGVAFAQESVGNVYGRVTDDKGEKLPGVTVTLSGPGAEKLQVTDQTGEFRFLGLDPGNYKIEAALEGFGTVVYEAVNVRIGRNTTIELAMNPAIEETITVTTESPLLDERKISQGIQVTQLELQKIPTSRDPWAVAGQTPGVLMDRINVGGNESGQQPNFIGSGAGTAQNKFMIDGVDITDMSALGASSTYFGFEQFEEMSFTTGGTDVTIETPGVQLNMVTKRGTNEWRGSGTYGLADKEYQASSNFGRDDLPAHQAPPAPGRSFGNRINKIVQYGVEAGGFVWKDRAWLWAAYDKNDIKNFVISGAPDNTILENTAYKLNVQITDANSFVATRNEGDKIKNGRDAGATRPPETTWDQEGPSPLTKYEDTHVFNSKFFLTASWSEIKGGFSLTPQGGVDAQMWQDFDGVFHGSYYILQNERPSERYKLDGSYFFSGGSTSHELKFGASHRKAHEFSRWAAPGNGIFSQADGPGGPGGLIYAQFVGENAATVDTEYDGIWLQDTISLDRLTINAGVRYDKQSGINTASTSPAHPVEPNLLPEINFQGNDPGYEWTDLSPRVGVSWSLGPDRKTLLRASFSRFADQLGLPLINAINPVATRYAYFSGVDTNGNGILDPSEPRTFLPDDSVNFNPDDPTSLSSPNQIDPNLEAVVTDELLVGIEHSLLPEFVIGANLTWRRAGDYYDTIPIYEDAAGNTKLLEASDWRFDRNITGTLRDGTTFSVPVYGVRPGLSSTGGIYYTNTDRETEYLGVSLTATKRLSNKWMLRGHFTWYDWEWKVGEEFLRYEDPTNQLNEDNNIIFGADDDGAIYADQSGGSGSFNQFLNSTWSFNVSGLYQLPWGLNVSANVNGREGYPIPFAARNVARPGAGNTNVQLTQDMDTYRMDDIYTIDARIDKDFQFGDFSATLSADIFNLLNDGAVIQYEYRSANVSRTTTVVPLGTMGNVNQVIGPRIVRFGVRLAWK
jgi:hypothetical protein